MKLLAVILKSLKEQMRSFWVLLLTLSMGPFFIFVYFLIMKSEEPKYTVLVVNNDSGMVTGNRQVNHGSNLIDFFSTLGSDTVSVPFIVGPAAGRDEGIDKIRNKKADALIVIDNSFSSAIENHEPENNSRIPKVEFIGDLTNTSYLISAVFANEILNEYVLLATGNKRPVEVKETALGRSASAGSFDLIVPGILILSLIMLMFTASIAFVSEVENKTIMRLKLSKITAAGFVGGISIVQLLVGILSVLTTLATSILLGFQYSGSIVIMILIASLTSLSIIAFSLIIAGITRSAGEVLVVGNFPMFLFMFFTGAAFPLNSEPWFTIAGYPVNIQGLMTPTHAISALNKTLIMDMDLSSVTPEIIAILLLTLIYFAIGGLIFRQRHLKLS